MVGDPEQGGVVVGGGHPVVRQSMLTSSTLDTEACVEQSMALVEVGCQIVRITAQTKRYAANLEQIVAGIRERGSNVPVVADIMEEVAVVPVLTPRTNGTLLVAVEEVLGSNPLEQTSHQRQAEVV